MRSPQRGEVWLVDLGMAAKVRPALAVSVPAEDMDRALVTLVPHTTSQRQSRFEVSVSGTRGLVLRARSRGVISRSRPVLERLRATGIFLADRVLAEMLAEVGE